MGANAQIAVPAFTAGQVLTAAQQTQINTGIPVFATTTTRDAAFGGTGEKTLAEGQFAYIEATDTTQYYNGSAWVSVGVSGLTYITQATPSAVNSVSINNCFSSTYDNYFITFTTSASVGVDSTITMRLRASGTDAITNYGCQRLNYYSTSVNTSSNPTSTDDWAFGFVNASNATSMSTMVNVFQPNIAVATRYSGSAFAVESSGLLNGYSFGGWHNTATAYDGFTLFTAGTSFTGTIRVYGYQNS